MKAAEEKKAQQQRVRILLFLNARRLCRHSLCLLSFQEIEAALQKQRAEEEDQKKKQAAAAKLMGALNKF